MDKKIMDMFKQLIEGQNELKSEMKYMGERLDGVESRLDGIDNRLDSVESRLDGVENEIKGLREDVKVSYDKLHDMSEDIIEVKMVTSALQRNLDFVESATVKNLNDIRILKSIR